MVSLPQILGLKRTRLTKLFEESGRQGWIDIVNVENYPLLSIMKSELFKIVPEIDILTSSSSEFNFPESLDDFGFIAWLRRNFDNKYENLIKHWSLNDNDIIDEQSIIHRKYYRHFPKDTANWIYFMTTGQHPSYRIVYIGVAESGGGLRKRFMHNDSDKPKADHWIGDCRSSVSNGRQYRSIRLKSSELRRRGVSGVWWAKLPVDPKPVEKFLITFKLKYIVENLKIDMEVDPVNQ